MSTPKTSAQVPKLRFPGFEGEWWKKPLQALSEKSITYGIVQTGEPVEGGVKCVRVVDLTKPQIDLSALITTTPEISRSYKRTILEEGEIMVALRGEIGLVAIVPAELAGSNLTRGIARIAPKRSEVTPGFLLWSLRTDDAKTEFNKQVNGSALKEIPINGLNKVEVQLTTVPEQQKIAAFLTAVDGRIEQLSRKKALLEEYKKGVMQQLFTQTLRFQDDHGHDFPDWEEKTLGSVATLVNGRAYKQNELLSEGPYPVLRVGNFFSNPEWYYSDLELPQDKYCDTGDLLYAWSASFGPRIWKGGKVIYHYHIWKVLPSTQVDKNYLFHFMDWDTERIKRAQSSGAVMLHVTKQSMEERPMPVPSLPEQKKIAGFLSALDGKIAAVGEQMRQTQAWKKGLLQQMFV